MGSFAKEFKEFIAKGNLMALAVGFVMGTTFAALLTAFVDNIIMPIVAIPFGKPSFDQALILEINDAQIRFGAFVTVAVAFVLIAFVLFLVVKAYNRLSRSPAGMPKPADIALLESIRDELVALRSQAKGD